MRENLSVTVGCGRRAKSRFFAVSTLNETLSAEKAYKCMEKLKFSESQSEGNGEPYGFK